VEAESAVLATGRVLQVNVSGGGVPKRSVDRAWVSTLGLEGDDHAERTLHGGPDQAVCLFGIEAIERMQAEGHPIEPGSAGENLTTTGIDWSLLPIGTRARIGADLELEISSSVTPCKTQVGNFSDGRYSRMNIELHPSDSRMYARVLRDGVVKPGDLITVLPAVADSRAPDALLIKRLDRAESKSSVAAWRAAVESGFDVRIVEDGELAMAASPEIHGPAFNRASGLARMPHLMGLATDFFDRQGCKGWLVTEHEPWVGAELGVTVGVYTAPTEEMADGSTPAGITLRPITPADGDSVRAIHAATGSVGVTEDQRNPWAQVYEKLATHPHRTVLLAELDGEPVGAASVHTYGGIGWLRAASVIPSARGMGIQRALIAVRTKIAAERGCEIVGAWAEPDGVSAANLMMMGMRQIGMRRHYLYVPPTSAD
jgi:MOSC domain-containing protein YiiM/GNAT superfamily N-acetyltransferase